ncbi:hypothetical protein ACEPAI_5768 [Sanghuangporus weigelae]
MQSSFANGLKTASRTQAKTLLRVQPNPIASTSRSPIQWEQRRTAWSPMDWFRRTLTPQTREKDNEKEIEEARKKAKESGEASVFEYEDTEPVKVATTKVEEVQDVAGIKKGPGPLEHKGATKDFRISHRKLNKLARQIAGKPVDSAILQMIFSEKRASGRIKSMLAQAKGSAVGRGMDPERLIVAEAWVNKGPGGIMNKRVEIKGRGKVGVQTRYQARMVVKLREGLTFEEKRQRDREVKLKRIVSAGLNREDVPLRNPAPQWAW